MDEVWQIFALAEAQVILSKGSTSTPRLNLTSEIPLQRESERDVSQSVRRYYNLLCCSLVAIETSVMASAD